MKEGLVENIMFYLKYPELFDRPAINRLHNLGYIGRGGDRWFKIRGFFINIAVKIIRVFYKPYKKYPYRHYDHFCHIVIERKDNGTALVRLENGRLHMVMKKHLRKREALKGRGE